MILDNIPQAELIRKEREKNWLLPTVEEDLVNLFEMLDRDYVKDFIKEIKESIKKLTTTNYVKIKLSSMIEKPVFNYIKQELKNKWFKVFFRTERREGWKENYMIITI